MVQKSTATAPVKNAMSQPSITKQTRIAVLLGGLSSERDVSLRSGKNCFEALKRLGYQNAESIDVDYDIAHKLKEKNIEIAFLCLHGKYGEDGAIQGLLELLRVPYTGSGVLASALAMNKTLTKQVLKSYGIPYPTTTIFGPEHLQDLESHLSQLAKPPLMVKPVAEGSSVGVVKVDEQSALASCVRETIQKYGGALVETYVKGQEITVGVLEEKARDTGVLSHLALPILELRPKSKAGFYDYEAKYTKGMTEFVLPAEISKEATELAQKTAVETFKALQCSGYARVDMIVDASGKPHVLEVNTLPGMTDTSDLPAMCEVAGITYDQLVERILFSSGLDK